MKNKRLNIKFLALLAIGSVVFAGGVIGLHGLQVHWNAEGLLKRAEAERADGNAGESARLRMRYLSHVPDGSDEAAEQYKQAAIDLKDSLFDKLYNREEIERTDGSLAFRYMEEAIQRNGKDPEVRRLAADFWFKTGRYADARSSLEWLQEEGHSWDDDDRIMYIESLRLIGGPAEVKLTEELSKMIGYNPETGAFDLEASHPELLEAYQSLVLLLINKKYDKKAAVATMNQMCTVNETNGRAFLLRARLGLFVFGAEGRQQSHSDISKAYEINKDDPDIVDAKSQMLMETGNAEEAKALIEQGLERADSMPSEDRMKRKSRLYRMLANIYVTQKDNAGAMVVLDRANKEVPKDKNLLWTKARLLLDEKKYKEVEDLYPPLRKAGQEPTMINYLQARILMGKGEYKKAIPALRRIREVLPPAMQYEADVYLTEGYGRTDKPDLQLATIRELRKKNPNNPRVNESYLQTLMAQKRNQEAREFIAERIQVLRAAGQPVPQSYQLFALRLQMDKIETGSTSVSEDQLKLIQDNIRRVVADPNVNDLQKQTIMIDYFTKMNNPAKAKKEIRKAIDSSPDQFVLWPMLLDLADDEAEAVRVFEEAKQRFSDQKYKATLRAMRGKIAVKHAPDTAGAVLASLEKGIEEFTDNEQVSILFELGKLQLVLKNRPDGIRLLEAALQKAPTQTGILETLLNDAQSGTDPERVASIVQQIKDAVGTSDDTYRMAEARRVVWLIKNKMVPENQMPDALRSARELIQAVRSSRQEYLPVILVESDIERLAGNNVAAIELLKKAHELQRSNPDIIRMIAESYRRLGDTQQVDEWMQRLPFRQRNDKDNRIELQALMSRQGSWKTEDAQDAIKLLQEIAPESSDQVKDHLLRSRIFQFASKANPALMDKAEASARRAVELEPGLDDVWTNLVNIYKEKGDDAKALATIQQAELELPEQTKPFVLGRCYAIMGNYKAAQSNLMTALRNDPDNLRIKRMLAETLIGAKQMNAGMQVIQDIVKNGDPEADRVTVVWARQTLARLLASSKNDAAFSSALELLEANKVNGRLSREDLALYVMFCYSRSEKSSWKRALGLLDQIASERELTDDEIFMKAQLYEKFGDEHWVAVKKMATGVLTRNEGNVTAIDSYVKWLLKRGEVTEAERWADNNLNDGSSTRVRVNLHADAKRGEFRKAVDRIKKMTPANDKLTIPNNQSQLLTIAAISEELGQYDERYYLIAEQLLRRLASVKPSETLRVASVIGIHGDTAKVKEALEMCFAATDKEISPIVGAGVALAILREHPGDWEGSLAPSIQQTEKWLDANLAANPSDIMFQWRVAEFHDMIGNLDRVQAEYEKILNAPKFTNPTDRGMVMNNLAYAMALNGKGSEAMEWVEKAKQGLRDSADLTDTRGYVYYSIGETDKAISEFTKAIKLGMKSPQKLFHLALAFHKSGNSDSARGSWEEALSIGLTRYQLPPALRGKFDELLGAYGGTPVAQR